MKTALNYRLDTEMLEYVCNEYEKDRDHLVGKLSDIRTLVESAGTVDVRKQ
jgi:hypothetical protein